MTVPQCGMGRGLTTDERAGTDTLSLSEAWLAQRLFTGTSHRDGPTPAAAADAVPTQTVGQGPCGPVAAGCYGASAAELELEGVLTSSSLYYRQWDEAHKSAGDSDGHFLAGFFYLEN